MKAPQIDQMIQVLYGGKMCLDNNSLQLISLIYQELDQLSPCGDNQRHELWLEAERGQLEDYGDFEDWQDSAKTLTLEQFQDEWESSYPADTKYFFKLTTVQYMEYRSLFLNDHLIISVEPDREGCQFDISDFLTWILDGVRNAVHMVKEGTYLSYLEANLPYRYRTGTMPMQEYWKLYPEAKAMHHEIISEQECLKFDRLLNESEGVPSDRITQMTVNKYLYFCLLGYKANRLEDSNTKTALELYNCYADRRDGGLLTIDPDSPSAFDQWFELPHEKKWAIKNDSHLWEVMQGGSRTRTHMYVEKDERGYYLYLSAGEYCCPERAVLFYLALKRHGIPVSINKGKRIADYLCGRSKAAFVPMYYHRSDFYYTGMDDPEIMHFVHLPKEKTDEAIKKAAWYPIQRLYLKDNTNN